jgi:hypothetical protein
MRLSTDTTESTIRESLQHSAELTWGTERAQELQEILDRFAHSVWLVMQTPMLPLAEPPDQPIRTF